LVKVASEATEAQWESWVLSNQITGSIELVVTGTPVLQVAVIDVSELTTTELAITFENETWA